MKTSFLMALAMLLSITLVGQKTFNNGDGDNLFSNPNNWQGGVAPSAGENLTFNASCIYDLTTVSDTTQSITIYGAIELNNGADLILRDGSLIFDGDLDLNANGTSIDIQNNNNLVAYLPDGNSSMNLNLNSGSTLSISDGQFIILASGTKTFRLNGGNLDLKEGSTFYANAPQGIIQINNGSSITVERGATLFTSSTDEQVTLNGGTVTIKAGGTLGEDTYEHGKLTINSGPQFTFEPGANFLESVNDAWEVQINSGNLNFQFQLANQASGTWRQIAIPFDNATWNDGWGDLNPTVSAGNDHNLYYYDATNGGSGDANGWTKVANQTDAINHLVPYNVFTGGSNFSWSNSGVVTVPNSGWGNPVRVSKPLPEYTVSLEYTMDPNASPQVETVDQGWNFIANPYYAYLDIDDILADADFQPTYKSIHYWDGNNADYIAYVEGVSIINSNNGLSTPADGDGLYQPLIAPFQGFWVKANATSQTFKIKSTHRETEKLKTGTLNSNLKTSQTQLINLAVLDPQGRIHHLYYNDVPGETFEFGYKDALARNPHTLESPHMGHVTQKGEWLKINSGDFKQLGVQDLGFEVGGNGIYTWSLDTTILNSPLPIYLVDKKTQVTNPLHLQDYSFVNDPNFGPDRFEWYTMAQAIHLDEYQNSTADAFIKNNALHFVINGNNLGLTDISLHDISGRTILQTTQTLNDQSRVELPSLKPGVYILRMSHQNAAEQTIKLQIF